MSGKRGTAPRKTPLAQLVLGYLEQNPDEELTRSDIAAKFDIAPTLVDTELAQAVMGGRLHRERNEDDGIVWTLGSAKARSKTPFGAAEFASKTARRVKMQATLAIDLAAIRIEKGLVYQPPARRSGLWNRLFEQMTEVGDSFAMPIAGRNALAKAAADYKQANTSFKFAIHRVSDTEVRIWRAA
jgi:hypothetical protein